MKTKQEQIDEMIKIFTDNREVCHHMRCVECKYHGDKECMYSSYAYSLYQAGYGDVYEYKNRFEVADKDLTETREKLKKEEHERDRYKVEIERLKAETSNIRNDTAKEILYMLYDMGIDKEMLECCRIFDVNGVSLAKQICEKYGVEIEK